MPGVECSFIPAGDVGKADLDSDSQKRTAGGQLYDFFVPSSQPNCPHPSVMSRPDGHITGDIFEETRPGYYAFR